MGFHIIDCAFVVLMNTVTRLSVLRWMFRRQERTKVVVVAEVVVVTVVAVVGVQDVSEVAVAEVR